MTLQTSQIRLISEWWKAAREGRTLVLTVKGPGSDLVEARMREIQAMNPHLFPKQS